MKSISAIRSFGLFLCFFISFFVSSGQGNVTESYRVETVEMPSGLAAQVGGIDFLPEGASLPVVCVVR